MIQGFNSDTGEIFDFDDEGYELRVKKSEAEKLAIKRSYESKYMNEAMSKYNRDMGGFVFAIFKQGEEINKHGEKLLQADLTRLVFLATYLNYDGYLSYENGVIINKKKLKTLLNLSSSSFADFYNRVTATNILNDIEEKIYLNSNYFYKGNIKSMIKSQDYTRVYITSIRELYNITPSRQIKVLGLLYRALPYLNLEYNILCYNPMEKELNSVDYLSLREMADLFGYSVTKALKKELRNLKTIEGRSVFGFSTVGADDTNTKIFINPNLVYGGGNPKHLHIVNYIFRNKV